MDGDKLADFVAMADPRFGPFAAILEVLRSDPNAAERIENIFFADPRWTFQVEMGQQTCARADFHFGSNNAVRADFSGLRDARLWIYDGGRVNRHCIRRRFRAASLPYRPICT